MTLSDLEWQQRQWRRQRQQWSDWSGGLALSTRFALKHGKYKANERNYYYRNRARSTQTNRYTNAKN